MKINIDDIEPVAHDLMRHCQQRLGFKNPPGLFFAEDDENGAQLLGKTAYYDPSSKDVTVFITQRHGKDILRSIAHELVHHMQNLRGDFESGCETTPGYAQTNPKLRKMEAEAYLLGNMLFRDWEDGCKSKKLQEQKEKFTMNKSMIKKMIREEIMRILNEDAKTPIEEECDDCPDVQKESLGQHLRAKSLSDIDTTTGTGAEYLPPGVSSTAAAGDEGADADGTFPGDFPSAKERAAAGVRLGPADEDDYGLEEGCDEEELEEGNEEDTFFGKKDALTTKLDMKGSGEFTARPSADPLPPHKRQPWSDEAMKDEDGDDLADPLGESDLATVRTPEMENALYESRFTGRDTNLFKKLVGKWAK
jgi:hypothetical protein